MTGRRGVDGPLKVTRTPKPKEKNQPSELSQRPSQLATDFMLDEDDLSRIPRARPIGGDNRSSRLLRMVNSLRGNQETEREHTQENQTSSMIAAEAIVTLGTTVPETQYQGRGGEPIVDRRDNAGNSDVGGKENDIPVTISNEERLNTVLEGNYH